MAEDRDRSDGLPLTPDMEGWVDAVTDLLNEEFPGTSTAVPIIPDMEAITEELRSVNAELGRALSDTEDAVLNKRDPRHPDEEVVQVARAGAELALRVTETWGLCALRRDGLLADIAMEGDAAEALREQVRRYVDRVYLLAQNRHRDYARPVADQMKRVLSSCVPEQRGPKPRTLRNAEAVIQYHFCEYLLKWREIRKALRVFGPEARTDEERRRAFEQAAEIYSLETNDVMRQMGFYEDGSPLPRRTTARPYDIAIAYVARDYEISTGTIENLFWAWRGRPDSESSD